MAEGKHPIPFRTRKLSPPAPMVLLGQPGGRVGHRRDFFYLKNNNMELSLQKRTSIAEKFLYHIWDAGHLRMNDLYTTNSERLEIISKGRWNVDTGPDFKGALIKLNGQLLKGDVEIHVQENDWYAHGHHRDPIYDNVILHAVLWTTENAKQACTKSGKLIPTLILSDFLDESIGRLQTHVDTEPQPSLTKPKACLLNRKPEFQIISLLEHWGIERLRLKKERFQEETDYFSFNQLLYQGFMEALGYSVNRRPFLKLAFKLPLDLIIPHLKSRDDLQALKLAQALLFGAAGLLVEDSQGDSETKAFHAELWPIWQKFRRMYHIQPMLPEEWQFFRLRPNNFPTMRLAGMASLLVKYAHQGFLKPILHIFQTPELKTEKICSELQNCLIVSSFEFWLTHYRFDVDGSVKSRHPGNLIGKEKAREMVVNVVLPVIFAYAEQTGDHELLNRLKEVYLCFPLLEENKITREMKKQVLITNKTSPKIINTACRQQGLIHIYKCFCQNWQCETCVGNA